MSFLFVFLVTEGALIIFFPDKKRKGALIGAGALNGANTVVSFVLSNDQERLEIAQDWQGLRAGLTCFWSSLINVISKDVNMVFCLSCIIRRLKA